MNGNQIIFLSSTFKDMHAERDLVHSIILPELSAQFESSAVTFDFIDLRWGVDTADEQDEQQAAEKILHVCFDEIERSKPFFICFLGERYGWIPKEENIRGTCLNTGLSPEQFSGKSITEMEIEFALTQFENLENCYFFFREGLQEQALEASDLRSVYFAADATEKEKVRLLKQRLREKYPEQVFTYTCCWDAVQQKVAGLEELGKLISQKVKDATVSRLSDKELALQDPYQRERLFQEKYFAATAAATIDRPSFTKPILDFVWQEAAQRELALVAPSGLGKSSLAAWVVDRLEREGICVLKLSTGLTSDSLGFRFAVRYLYRCLCDDFGYAFEDGDHLAIKQNFYSLLSKVSEERKVVILLDALNQFDDSEEARKLDWINELFIPENVRILYTSIPEVYDQVFRKRDVRCLVLDHLENSEITQIAQVTAKRFHKQLAADVLTVLCEKKDGAGQVACRSPLYLSMLMEYISDFDIDDYKQIALLEKTLGGAQSITRYIHGKILAAPGDTGTLFEAISQKCAKHIGAKKTGFITTILAQSRFGLREKDICAVSEALGIFVTPADFSMYRKMFRLHLVQRNDGRWDFSHAMLRATLTRSAEANSYAAQIRQETALYFLDQTPADPLRQNELIYYLSACGMYTRLRQLFAEEAGAAQVNALKEVLCGKDAKTHLPRFFDALAPAQEQVWCLCACKALLDTARSLSTQNTSPEERLLHLHLLDFLRKQELTEQSLPLTVRAYYVYGALEEKQGGKQAALYFDLALGIAQRKAPLMLPGLYTDIFRVYQASGNKPRLRSTANAFLRSIPRWKKQLPNPEEFLAMANYCKAQSLSHSIFTRNATLEKWYQRALDVAPDKTQLQEEIFYRLSHLQGRAVPVTATFGDHEKQAQLYIVQGDREYTDAPQKAIACYESALAEVRNGLLHKEIPSLLILYQGITERLAYAYAEQGTKHEEAQDCFQTAQSLCKKLCLITGEHSWNDRRATLLADHARLFPANHRALEESAAYTKAVIESGFQGYRPAFNKTAEQLVLLLLVALLTGIFLVVPLVFMIGEGTWNFIAALESSDVLRLFSDTLQFLCSFLMALAVYQFQQNLSQPDRNTVTYAYGKKKSVQYTVVYFAALLFSVCYGAVRAGILFMIPTPDYLANLFSGTYYYVLNATLTFLLVWIVCVLVRRLLDHQTEKGQHPAWRSLRRKLCFRHSCGFALRRVVVMLLVPVPLFLGMVSGLDFEALTYTGTKLPFFWDYHWFPFVVECLFSACWLYRLKRTDKAAFYPAPKVAPALKKELAKPLIKGLAVASALSACAAGFFLLTMGASAGRNMTQYLYQDGFYYELRDTGAAIRGYDGEATVLKIPDELGDRPVTTIGINAFREHTDTLQKITLPDSVTLIEGAAFQNCEKLEQVGFGTQLTVIDTFAFQGCTALKEVRLPDSVTTIQNNAFLDCSGLQTLVLGRNLEVISDKAFRGCTALVEVQLPDTLKTLGEEAFCQCSSLVRMTLPESIRSIGSNAFEDCSGLTQISLPSNLEALPAKLFSGCSSLVEITFPKKLQAIENWAFSDCDALETFTIPDTVTELGTGVFSGCDNLRDVVLPLGITELPQRFLENCTGLTRFTVPDHITELSEWAFEDCKNLEQLTLGSGVTHIAKGAFTGCESLKTVVIHATAWEWSKAFSDSFVETMILGEGAQRIPEEAFYNCATLQEIYFPESLKTVGRNAFLGCDKLKKVHIASLEGWCGIEFARPENSWEEYVGNPLQIAESLVLNDQIIEDLVIPGTVRSVDNFDNYQRLKSVTFQEGVEEIRAGAFSNCDNLETVRLANSIRKIDSAFDTTGKYSRSIYISSLEAWCAIEFGDGNPAAVFSEDPANCCYPQLYFGERLFDGDVIIPETVKRIGSYAFFGIEVQRMYIPETVESIGQCAFWDVEELYIDDLTGWCKRDLEMRDPSYWGYYLDHTMTVYVDGVQITDLVIPRQITTIKDYAFQGWLINSVSIHSGVTAVGKSAFNNTGVETAYLPDLNTYCRIRFGDEYASPCSLAREIWFDGEKAENTLMLPKDLSQITDYAFTGFRKVDKIIVPSNIDSIGEKAFSGCYADVIYK